MASYLKCPLCGYRLRTRNSTGQHPLLRTEYLQCLNPGCYAAFRGTREITHELSPSGLPNPGINLPRVARAENERITAELTGNTNQLDLLHADDSGPNPSTENTHD
ncbi:MAG: ogr/Delta-like zinc finger family protein [Porticoccaceae bacterium]